MKVEHRYNNKKSSTRQPALSAEELLGDLANLPDKGVSRFREKWGRWYWSSRYSDEDILKRRDELRLLWTHRLWEYPPQEGYVYQEPLARQERKRRLREERKLNEPWYVEHPDVVRPDVPRRAKRLYSAWDDQWADADSRWQPPDLEEVICEHWLKLEPLWWRVIWQKNQKAIGVQQNCLPGMLASTCLRVVERLGLCRNPKCARPYFFLQRRDQLYCSSECAKPARRASKLKWWHERRGRKIKAGADTVFPGDFGMRKHTPLRPPLKRKKGGTD